MYWLLNVVSFFVFVIDFCAIFDRFLQIVGVLGAILESFWLPKSFLDGLVFDLGVLPGRSWALVLDSDRFSTILLFRIEEAWPYYESAHKSCVFTRILKFQIEGRGRSAIRLDL